MTLLLNFDREVLIQRLTRELRDVHEACKHPDCGTQTVCLVRGRMDVQTVFRHKDGERMHAFDCLMDERSIKLCPVTWCDDEGVAATRMFGREDVPGDGAKFDARAAAIRLVSDLMTEAHTYAPGSPRRLSMMGQWASRS